jgi:hypothetical protein
MLSRLSRRLRPRSIYDVMAAIACFGVLAGGTAYAANTIGSTDIIDGQVKSADIGDAEILSADVKDQSLTTFDVSTFLGADVVDGTLTGADVADTSSLAGSDIHEEVLLFNNTLNSNDLGTGSVGTDEAQNDSLTGADINESSLSMPPTTTVGFAGFSSQVIVGSGMTLITSKNLSPGDYAAVATVNIEDYPGTGDSNVNMICELRGPGGFVGGVRDRRLEDGGELAWRSLSMNGGVHVTSSGTGVGLYCSSDSAGTTAAQYGQIMITRIDGFF